MKKDINNIVITSANPCLMIYMIDQSSSMEDPFGNSKHSKAQEVCDAINAVIYETLTKCISNGIIKNRVEIALFAYYDKFVASGWGGSLSNKFLHITTNIFQNPLNPDDDVPKWVLPNATGATPMLAAFKNVKELCEDWINWGSHREECHPPVIINITDGEATDDDSSFTGIKKVVQEINRLETDYGKPIIMNIHISSRSGDRMLFPDQVNSGDAYERLLFDISSPLYEEMILRARKEGYHIKDNARGYIFNGAATDLIKFFNIGTPHNGGKIFTTTEDSRRDLR